MDPGPLTARELEWMARERERAEWDRTAWVMAWVGRVSGGKFEPDRLNPVRLAEAPKPAKRVVSKEESDTAFRLFKAFLTQNARNGG